MIHHGPRHTPTAIPAVRTPRNLRRCCEGERCVRHDRLACLQCQTERGREDPGEGAEGARKIGYRPNLIARSLALSRTRTIGVVIPEISHSFFPEAIRGIEEVTT